MLVKIYLNI